MCRSYFKTGLLVLLAVAGVSASAGVIELNNGDKIHGDLVNITEEQVIWQSELLGELEIPHSSVKAIESDATLEIVDQTEPCKLGSMVEGVALDCAGKSVTYEHLSGLASQLSTNNAPLTWVNKGNFSLAAYQQRGNTYSDEWYITAETRFTKGPFRHRLEFDYENYVSGPGETDEEYKALYAYDYFFSEQWFFNTYIAWEKDEARNLEAQYDLGAGLGHQFWETETKALEIEAGLSYITKDFLVDDPTADGEYGAGRWSLDWWHELAEDLRVFHNHQLLQSFQQSNDYEVDTETGLRYFFNAALHGEIKYEWDYDNDPAGDAEREDTKWTLGAGYRW